MTKKREHWKSSFGFVMAAAGSAIGLGTLWKFPYMVGENGGGFFVLVYLLCTLFIGIPAFIAELVLGRVAQKSAVATFHVLSSKRPFWFFTGWIGVITSLFILSYYCVVAGWSLSYFFMSLNGVFRNMSDAKIVSVFDDLYHSGSMSLFWQILFLGMTAFVVYQGVRKGIEYWSKILTSSLLVLLLLLFIYVTFLGGFWEACKFVFIPKMEHIKPSSILAALGLAFFTLSVGQGIMITYGSYMEKESDIPKTALIVGAMDIVVSLFCALMIFPIIFTFGFSSQQGIGLVFKTLPLLFTKLPAGMFISALFFVLFMFTALTSSVALLEVLVANWMDLKGMSRKKAVIIATLLVFILGIPCALSGTDLLFANWKLLYGTTFFETMVFLVSSWTLPISGFLVVFFSGWRLKKEMAKHEFQLGTGYKWMFSVWYFFIRYIAPVAIFLIILQSTGLIDLDQLMR
jgi:NSS family neurotransmitter:Na+ symporter